MNWENLWVREKIIDVVRAYFKERGFHEVETPLLVKTPSTEPFLEVFETELVDDVGKKQKRYLPTSPEFAMKKMLSAGSGSIFQITKSFRNGEGKSPKHSPEFTILEWYEVGGDYMTVVKDFEKLMREICQELGKKDNRLSYQGKTYDLGSSWEQITVTEAFERYADINQETMLNEKKLKEVAIQKGYQISRETTWEEVWNQIMANEIEPKLGQTRPTVIKDYPVSQAALARKKSGDPRFAERAEVYLGGMELANIFSELTDWREQEARCKADLAERKKLGKKEYPIDREFIEALKKGMPKTGGIAVGVDRLVMLMTDANKIEEVTIILGAMS
ncbi:MAG: EF-P lysine aminoacylase EpmA [bacterium]